MHSGLKGGQRTNVALALVVVAILPFAALLLAARPGPIGNYTLAGAASVIGSYAILAGGGYLVASKIGASQRSRLCWALLLGLLYCYGLVVPPIRFG